MTVLLAGRASEELIFNEVSTGAQNDLQQATYLARKMVLEYGMSAKLGPVVLTTGHEEIFLGRDLLKERNYSEELAFEVDKEIHRMIGKCYQRAKKILRENEDKLIKLAELLEEKEVLGKEEIKSILGAKVNKEKEEEKKTEEKVITPEVKPGQLNEKETEK